MTQPNRRPSALRPGDRVAVLAMSSPAPAERLVAGCAELRAAGLEPVLYDSAIAGGGVHPWLAGTEDLRAADLRAALLDETIAGVLFAHGGVGSQRALAAFDWSGLDAVAPKVVVGYSDVTAVLEAIAARLGWVSVLSLVVVSDDPPARAALLRMLMDPAAESVRRIAYREPVTVNPGRATGITCGGNLSLIAASIGTDTCWRPADGVVVLEDVGEHAYRIDRMLTQLLRAGYFDSCAAVIGGQFTDCGSTADVDRVLTDQLGELGVPMILHADVGHGGRTQPFPIGVAAELDADAGVLTLAEPALVPVD